tara:strand:+ start:146 stop:574 length:429 start_codon:yes stop_codon:yes gene_type:complete
MPKEESDVVLTTANRCKLGVAAACLYAALQNNYFYASLARFGIKKPKLFQLIRELSNLIIVLGLGLSFHEFNSRTSVYLLVTSLVLFSVLNEDNILHRVSRKVSSLEKLMDKHKDTLQLVTGARSLLFVLFLVLYLLQGDAE